MAENLVIVESPAKAGTIEKYLGSNYQVIASMGHVRDLPKSKIGVDVDAQFAPQYVVPVKAKATLKKLKAALKDKKTVFLATDLDREGEAIAWHVAQALELEHKKGVILHRITFDEITKTAIQNAVAHPRELDYKLIDAQQARRVLDRLVGYTLSPVLWKKLYKGLSAGRVQSVALRLIVDREAERNAFQPVEYWSLEASVKTDKKEEFSVKLISFAGNKIEQMTIGTAEQAEELYAALQAATYVVQLVTRKPVKRRPSGPYTTSTFQQDAVNKLGMSAKNAMRTAQKLYEAGHITYMRTDSTDLAAETVLALRQHIGATFGNEYLPEKPNRYATKSKQAQEAHEAIRPTHPERLPEEISGDAAAQKVYALIRNRALACQMVDAQLEQTAVDIAAGKGIFRANGQRIVFPGFMAAYPVKEKEDEQRLPKLQEKQSLVLNELKSEQHFTEPPPRFSEATLIKALEEHGIGRPSTYAPTIDTLVARQYVLLEQRRFIPETIGVQVTKLLTEHFPEIVDLNFTAGMEDQLDQVAAGEMKYADLLGRFWVPFHKAVEEKTESIEKVDTTEETDEVCPTCGAPMLIKRGRFGKFLACSKFPDCKTTKPLNTAPPTALICPIDGRELVWKKARRGAFIGCSGYPSCTFALWKREQLPNKIEELKKEETALPFEEQALEAFRIPPVV